MPGAWAFVLCLALGCGQTKRNAAGVSNGQPANGGAANSATSDIASSSAGGSSTGQSGGSAGTGNDTCGPNAAEPWVTKHLVRLSFNQLTTSIRTIFGDALADQITSEFAIRDRKRRSLLRLADPSNGWVVNDAIWSVSDGIGRLAPEAL